MVNPIKVGSAPFPPPNQSLVDPGTGNPTAQAYLWLVDVQNRTGGNAGISLTGVSTTANNALQLAGTANAQAVQAHDQAVTAQTTANTALEDAGQAQSTANTALTQAQAALTGSLSRSLNLSDLTSVPTARSNLGVETVPLTFIYDGMPGNGLTRYVPIVQALTMPSHFAGLQTWCGTVPTLDAIFTINYIRAGVSYPIGTVTLIHGGQYNGVSPFAAIDLLVGDKLQIIAPSPQDATLENCSIALALSLT